MQHLHEDALHAIAPFLASPLLLRSRLVNKEWRQVMDAACKNALLREWKRMDGCCCPPPCVPLLIRGERYPLALSRTLYHTSRQHITEWDLTAGAGRGWKSGFEALPEADWWTWSFRFKQAAGEDWTDSDPYWQGEEAMTVRFQISKSESQKMYDEVQTAVPNIERQSSSVRHLVGPLMRVTAHLVGPSTRLITPTCSPRAT